MRGQTQISFENNRLTNVSPRAGRPEGVLVTGGAGERRSAPGARKNETEPSQEKSL